ncbi:MAG: hypothetical protein NTV51_04635 [Verrucomicrobia bacterium]|nr:hypothetical protein [Verrucomicrobiota bacterium]
MNFNSLVTRLELNLLPVVRAEEARLRASGKFTSVEVFSLRHAEFVHALGIACRPTWAAIDLERLSFGAVLNEMSGLSGRIDVQWSQSFTPRTGTGYVKRETDGFHSNLTTEVELARFEARWRRPARRFVHVAERGRPSPWLVRWLRGAPHDLYGGKDDATSPTSPSRVGAL